MRIYVALLVLALGVVPAAAGPYLFDLLEIGTYRASWDALLAEEDDVPAWIAAFSNSYDGVASPSEDVQYAGQDYIYATVCKPHDCGANFLHVLFDWQGERAWALLEEDRGDGGTNLRFFGDGDADAEAALGEAAERN